MWTMELQVHLIGIKWTLSGRHLTVGGNYYFSLNEVLYSHQEVNFKHAKTWEIWRMDFFYVGTPRYFVEYREECIYLLEKLEFIQTGMSRVILAKNRNIEFHENLLLISPVVKFRRTDRKEKITKIFFLQMFNSLLKQKPHSKSIILPISAHIQTERLSYSASSCTAHLLYKCCTNCRVCNWTVLTVITQKLPLHVQLHNSTAHLLYKRCTNCTVCNWTVLTVIRQKLPLHVQLHNSTAHLLYKYCTNCTVCNWTVLTVITQKLLLHVQLHNSTAHLLYKYSTYSTVCKFTVFSVITRTLLLHVQLHNSTHTLRWFLQKCSKPRSFKLHV
jgi:hypothetical protein